AEDEDGDDLTYTWDADNGMLSGSGATINWTAPINAGDYNITCNINDGNGGEDSKTFAVRVRDLSITQSGSLVAFYPFTNFANDESGNNLNGTVHDAYKGADRFLSYQKAYYFDGDDDYIKVANHALLNFQNAITVNFWIKIGTFYAREAYPLSHNSWDRWKLSITNQRMRWTIKTDKDQNNGIIDLDSETKLETGEWYNITALYSGADFEIWINGELDAFSTWSGLILPSPVDLMFGQVLPDNPEYNFRGGLDEIRIYDYALSVEEIINLDDVHTGIDDQPERAIPTENFLTQNYPNPFNNQTIINYQIKEPGNVKIYIYDLLGRKVRTLVNEDKEPGYYNASWEGMNDQGSYVTSGVYFYSMRSGDFSTCKKLVMIK
ncbi:LamG-like jellyroll fold domain-containing protein, partial [Bacteroidota bacterium]